MRKVRRPLLGGRAVAFAGLVCPGAVRLEIGRGRDLRRADLSAPAELRDDLRRQEVRVDDDVPRPALQQVAELEQVELLERLGQPGLQVLVVLVELGGPLLPFLRLLGQNLLLLGRNRGRRPGRRLTGRLEHNPTAPGDRRDGDEESETGC